MRKALTQEIPVWWVLPISILGSLVVDLMKALL